MRRNAFKWAADEMAAEQTESGAPPDANIASKQMQLEAHEQKLRHNEDLHAAKIEAEKIKLQLAQEQASRKLNPPATPMDINALRDFQAKDQIKYRDNLIPKQPPNNPLAKRAAEGFGEDSYADAGVTEAAKNYGNPLSSIGIGAGAGALGAHYVSPTEETRKYRKALQALESHVEDAKKVRVGGKIPANVIIEDAGKRYHLPADEAARLLRTLAHSSNAKRLAKGGAIGAGAGLLASILFNSEGENR